MKSYTVKIFLNGSVVKRVPLVHTDRHTSFYNYKLPKIEYLIIFVDEILMDKQNLSTLLTEYNIYIIRWLNNFEDFYWILIDWFMRLCFHSFQPLIAIYRRSNFVY